MERQGVNMKHGIPVNKIYDFLYVTAEWAGDKRWQAAFTTQVVGSKLDGLLAGQSWSPFQHAVCLVFQCQINGEIVTE